MSMEIGIQPLCDHLISNNGYYDKEYAVITSWVRDPEFSDFKIKCQGHEWLVHKVIICHESRFFRTCIENFKESKQGFVELDEDHPRTINHALKFMYRSGTVQPSALRQLYCSIPRLYAFADKYEIVNLREVILASVRKLVRSSFTSDHIEVALVLFTDEYDHLSDLREVFLENAALMAQRMIDGEWARELQSLAHTTTFGMYLAMKLATVNKELNDKVASLEAAESQSSSNKRPRTQDATGLPGS